MVLRVGLKISLYRVDRSRKKEALLVENIANGESVGVPENAVADWSLRFLGPQWLLVHSEEHIHCGRNFHALMYVPDTVYSKIVKILVDDYSSFFTTTPV